MTPTEGAPLYLAWRFARGALARAAHETLGRAALVPARAIAGLEPSHDPVIPPAPGTVLVVCPGKIGDTVCAEPAIRILRERWPAAKLIALGARARGSGPVRGGAEVLPLIEGLDEVHTYARLREARALAGRSDLVIVLGLRARDAWAGLLARGTRGVAAGFSWAGRGHALDLAIDPPEQVMVTARAARAARAVPQHLFWVELLAALGIPTASVRPPRLAPKPAHDDDVRAILSERGFSLDGLAVLAPWNDQPHFRWPEARWVALGRALLDEKLATTVAILGGYSPDERASCERIAREIGPRATSFARVLGIDRSVALLARAALVVAIDSGPAHLARAVGAPTVVVFGPGSPVVWAPPGAIAVQRDDGCFGCRQPRCSVAGHECLDDLGVERVLAAARIARKRLPTI